MALFSPDLRSLVLARGLGRRMGRVVAANITFAMLTKVRLGVFPMCTS